MACRGVYEYRNRADYYCIRYSYGVVMVYVPLTQTSVQLRARICYLHIMLPSPVRTLISLGEKITYS